jgi:hypothetical protein
MQIVIRLLLCLVSLAAFVATVCAQEPIASPSASAVCSLAELNKLIGTKCGARG